MAGGKQRLQPGEAFKKILEELKKGPASPKELMDKLNLSDRTVDTNLKFGINAKIFEKLDDKYALIWYRKEYRVRTAYEKLKKKFFGEPPLIAISVEIKETPEKTRELLSKYTYYREPTEEEMAKSASEIQKYLLWKCWTDQKLHERNFKKWGLEKRIEKLLCSGIDQNSFLKLIDKQDMPSIDQVQKYPDLKIRVEEKIEESTAHYTFIWSEEVKELFEGIFPNLVKPWEVKGQISLPRKLDKNKYYKYKGMEGKPELDLIKNLARDSVPDDEALEDCLKWLKNPNLNHKEVLYILGFFCINAKDCKAIPAEKEEAVLDTLANIAFNIENVDKKLRWEALNIIKIFGSEKVKDRAKAYCLKTVKKGYDSDYLFEIAEWLCEDPKTKNEILGEAEQIVLGNSDEKIKNIAKNLIYKIHWGFSLNFSFE